MNSLTSENNKRIAKNTMMLYFRMLFNMGVTLYTSRVVLNALGVEDFGIYNIVGGIVIMFTFLNTAMTSSTQRFLTFELGKTENSRLQTVFCTAVNIHILIALVILLLSETFGLWFLNTQMVIPAERMVASNWVYQFSLLSCCIGIAILPYNAVIIAHEKMSAFAYISVFEVSAKLLVVYLLVLFPMDKLILYAGLLFCVSLITQSIYVFYSLKYFSESKYKRIWDKELFKYMTSFAGWTMVSHLGYMGYTQGINILLNLFFGPAVNAARGIAVQVQGAVWKFSSSFQTAVSPQITKRYANNELNEMHSLILSSSKFSFFLLFLISLPIMLQTKQILIWWLKDVPNYTVIFIRIIILISMIDTLATPLNIAAQATGQIKIYQLLSGALSLLIVPLSYIVLKLIHDNPEIVFIIHLIIAFLILIVRLYLLKKMINLSIKSYLKDVIVKIILVSCVVTIPLKYIEIISPSLFHNFWIITLFSTILSIVTIYMLGLSSAEKYFIYSKIRKYVKK